MAKIIKLTPEQIVAKIAEVKRKIDGLQKTKTKLSEQGSLYKPYGHRLNTFTNRYDAQLDRLTNEYLKLAEAQKNERADKNNMQGV